jgi:hypothetical protein
MRFTPAIIVQQGVGKGRDPWLIRRWMSGLGLTMNDVAAKACTKRQTVGDTLRGMRNHRRTLETLEMLGCPPDLLYPQRQRHGRAA